MRIAIVAGEQSGDQLGAGLIRSLRQRRPDLEFEGIGGPLMEEAGCRSLYPMQRLSVMGLFEVLGRLRELTGIRRRLLQRWIARPPEVFIGIDAPDFNLTLERRLKQKGIATVHYVSPSVWAWRQYRVRRMQHSMDLMLTLFPFEAAFYEQAGVPVQFVGHPLADRIPLQLDQASAREALGLAPRARIIALLPGSREGEVARLCVPFLQAAAWCHERHPELQFIVPVANPAVGRMIETERANFPGLPVELFYGQAGPVMAAADLMLVASGTATLQGLLYKRPMVVAYRLAAATYWLVRRMLKTDWYSLPNLLANKGLVPEVTQQDVTAERLGQEMLDLLEDEPRMLAMREAFASIHETLRQDANEKAARAILEIVEK